MTPLALNLIALLLVLGMAWAAMMWMSGRFHGHGQDEPLDGDFEIIGESLLEPPCTACDGVGARQRLGRLEPCSECDGTGVAADAPGGLSSQDQ